MNEARSSISKRRPAFTLVEVLVVIAIIGILMGMLLPAIQMSREYARRTTCKSRLGQLAMAIHNYQDAHTVYPPGTVNPQGPITSDRNGDHHSWISFLLPFLEEGNVAKRIDRSKSVYAPENAEARGHKVRILQCPSEPLAPSQYHASSYAGVQHPTEAPIQVDNLGMFFLNSRLTPDDVRDGKAHTLFVGERLPELESANELGWISGTRATLRNTGHPLQSYAEARGNKPEEQAATWVGGFGSSHPGVVQFALGNGAVTSLSRLMDQKALQQLADRQDGALVNEELYGPDSP